MFTKAAMTILLLLCLHFGPAVYAYEYDPNDFAIEVITYIEGLSADTDWIDGTRFNNPYNALGRPTVDTTGDIWNIPVALNVPVVSVYSAFRSFEVVTVGDGGELILKFNHPVEDDENNPYGIDLIIFGNAQQEAMQYWLNGDPNLFMIQSSDMIEEPGVVSVSQDGLNWYRYTNGLYADTFAPTFGRIYDPNNPDKSIGSWNDFWAEPTNPTVPVDPLLTSGDTAGMTVAEMSQIYGSSAGGTGFDLDESSMDWILYVRIEGNESVTPEIDAVADVSCCGDYKHPSPLGDITFDCSVDYEDIEMLSYYWLAEITVPDDPAIQADIYEDDVIDFKDWALLVSTWRRCTWQCQ
ncbi:MAG: hypothetical protein ACYSSI_00440 [Planctomycetota bacterium]|jgi:hypothetical protein